MGRWVAGHVYSIIYRMELVKFTAWRLLISQKNGSIEPLKKVRIFLFYEVSDVRRDLFPLARQMPSATVSAWPRVLLEAFFDVPLEGHHPRPYLLCESKLMPLAFFFAGHQSSFLCEHVHDISMTAPRIAHQL